MNDESWKGEHFIRARPREEDMQRFNRGGSLVSRVPEEERRKGGAMVRPPPPPRVVCAVPGCGRVLRSDSYSGVCRDHNHAPGYCQCRSCRK